MQVREKEGGPVVVGSEGGLWVRSGETLDCLLVSSPCRKARKMGVNSVDCHI